MDRGSKYSIGFGWMGRLPSRHSVCINQRPLYGAVSSLGRIHGSGNQAEVTPLTMTPNAPPRNFVLPVPTTLDSAG